jgi:four helix bundle protein
MALRLLDNSTMAHNPPDFGPRTFAFACDIVRLYQAFVAIPEFPVSIARQILKAGTSVGANIEEGRAPSSRRDLTNHHRVALREARETKFWLRLVRATNLAPPAIIDAPLKEADELVAILTVSVRNLRNG